jgi:hypothetical protein
MRALINFDLGLIPNDALINSATLNLYTASTPINGMTMRAHPITAAWTIPTWTTQPGFDATRYGSVVLGTETGAFTINVKAIVQDWVNGVYPNYGFMLKDSSEASANTVHALAATENGVTANQPTLTIDYTIPTTGKKQVENVASVAQSSGVTVSSFTVPIPAGATAGDLLIVQIVGNTTGVEIVVPSGWNTLASYSYGNYRGKIVSKFMANGEPNPVFSTGGANNSAYNSAIHVFRNVLAINSSAITQPAGSVATVSPPAANLSKQKLLMVLLNGSVTGANFTPPLSYLEKTDLIASSTGLEMSMRYLHNLTSQTQSEMQSTLSASNQAASTYVALEPISNNPPTDPSGVTVDKSAYTVGDTITINFTGSTDADGDTPITYYAEMNYDGGVKTFGPVFESPITGVVPSRVDTTQAYVRVFAQDSRGAISGYGQSPLFSVAQKDGQILAPVNVVSSAYLVSRMAPPVRLSNGWFVGAVYDSPNADVYFYKSTDNGKTWSQLCFSTLAANQGLSLISKGTRVYCLQVHNTFVTPYLLSFDAASITNIDVNPTYRISVDSGQTLMGAASLAITPDGTKLWWASSTKNSTYPNSYNIRAGSIPINADGTLGTPSVVKQITTFNTSGNDAKNPSLTFIGNDPVVVYEDTQSTTYRIRAFNINAVTSATIATVASYAQSSPMAIRTPNGKLHVVWHGIDSVDSPNKYVLYNNSADGQTWGTAKKLVKGTDVVLSSDKNGKLTIHYEDGGYIKRIESTDEFATYTAPVTVAVGTMPASLYDPTFQFDFIIPPTFFQGSSSVKYYGSFDTNKAPTLTLTGPANNEVLTDGENYVLSGSALETDVNNVVSLKYKINSNPDQTFDSYVSDGTSQRTFNKLLLYSNQRITDAGADVSGVLAEGTTHTLSVWSEDNKGGKSPVVTRSFTVIANRAPVISGSNTDLGELSAKPGQTYSAADPESNSFTITEMIDGVITRTFAGVADRQETFQITDDQWLRLDLDVPHELRIRATDSNGAFSDRVYTFVRTETQIVFTLDYTKQNVIDFFTTDAAAARILFAMDWVKPPDATILVEACNNAYDASPAWEDITAPFNNGLGYTFANATKTASQWGINFRVTVDKNTATDRVIINGYRGAFD